MDKIMKSINFWIFLGIVIVCKGCSSSVTQDFIPKEFQITKEHLFDKVKGGWTGKVIGCTYGGSVEFLYNGIMIQDYVPIKWSKDRVRFYFDTFPGLYDDLYVNIIFVDVFERLRLNAPVDSFAINFANTGFPLWHANQAAKYNIKQGIMPPMSEHWLNNPHADDIDYQIEADFAGLMCPGMPNNASVISDKVGHIFSYGDGWYGGVFVGALYALSFVSYDMEMVVEEAIKTIPEQNDFYSYNRNVVDWYKEYQDDWKQTWFECEKKWSSEVGCPDGVFLPFNIDAKLKSAYVTIGLLYGKKDFFKTIDIAARCGQDSDCNTATAAGVLGTMLGYSNIPEYWKESLYGIEDIPFDYTNISLNKLSELSFDHALQVIKKEGGKIEGEKIIIQTQKPIAVKYEKSFENHFPVEKIAVNISLQDKAEFVYNGVGFVQKGYVKCDDENYSAKIEIYIDGVMVETANLPVVKETSIDDRRVDLFHKYQLAPIDHKVRYQWLNPRTDAQVYLGEAVIYSNEPNKLTYNK